MEVASRKVCTVDFGKQPRDFAYTAGNRRLASRHVNENRYHLLFGQPQGQRRRTVAELKRGESLKLNYAYAGGSLALRLDRQVLLSRPFGLARGFVSLRGSGSYLETRFGASVL